METCTKLFGSLLLFVYHCFDRIVINGYLSNLSRPEQVVYFFRQVLGIPAVSKEVLSQRTNDYRSWVEALPGIMGFPSNGRKRACARKTMSCSRCGGWKRRTPSAS